MALITVIFVFLFLYLTLVQEVTVKIIRYNETIIIIDFVVFSSEIYPERNKKRRKKRKDSFKKIPAIYKAITLLLKNSELTVNELNFPVLEGNPASDAPRNETISAIVLAVLTYFKTKVRTINLKDRLFTSYSDSNHSALIDISLKFELFRIFHPVFILVLDLIKRKREEKIV